MFTISVEVDGVIRKYDTLANSARDLEPALKKFGGYLKKRALERYRAQDFAPLAPSTVEKRAQKGLRTVERKLNRDVRRAVDGAGAKVSPTPSGAFARMLATSIATTGSKTVQKRIALLAEFQRRRRRSMSLRAQAGGVELSFKQQLALSKSEQKAMEKSVGAPILGKLIQSLTVETDRGTVTLASRSRGEWTDVHNSGGEAGRGAKIPKRETIKVESQDLDVFLEILKEHHLAPLELL